MDLTIQLPITWIQYSNRIAVLKDWEQTPEDIAKAFAALEEVDRQMQDIKNWVKAPVKTWVASEMILMENAQLKRSQELAQHFLNIFKYKYPELFEEVSLLVAESDADKAANDAVDDKLNDE